MGIPALLLGVRAHRVYPQYPLGPARFFTPANNYLAYLLSTVPHNPDHLPGTLGPYGVIRVRAACLFTIAPFLAYCSSTLPSPATPLFTSLRYINTVLHSLNTSDDPASPLLLLDSTCTACDNGDRCRCLRRPSSMAAALAAAGMLRVYGLIVRQRQVNPRVEDTAAAAPGEIQRLVNAERMLSDMLALLRSVNPPRLWAPVTPRDVLVRTLVDEPCAPPDVGATALLVATTLNLKMLKPSLVSEEEVQWAERQFGVVMEWVREGRIEMRGTDDPQCLTPCCVLMMIGAGSNPLLVDIMLTERSLAALAEPQARY